LEFSKYTLDLNTDIKYLKGVGPKRAKALYQNNLHTIKDILRYYPRKYLDRTNIKNISELTLNEKAVVIAKVVSMSVKKTKRGQYFQLTVTDGQYSLNCLWFHGISWVMEKFTEGDNIAIFGKIEFSNGFRIIHPEFDIIDDNENLLNTGKIIPLYSSNTILKNAGFDSRGFRRLLLQIFNNKRNYHADYFDQRFLKEQALLELNEAIYFIHNPDSNDTIQRALYRLKFNEHFFLQLLKSLNKKTIESYKGKAYEELGSYASQIYKALDFNLTRSQIKVLRDIRSDLKLVKPMNRLIQGDVGCGKTIVAVLTTAIVVGGKSQVAIMAPTEILAEQHFHSFKKHFEDCDINCELLISNIKSKEKNNLYKKLSDGEIDIIVGTHALIQKSVKFKDLGLIIIDEQHRFGVDQRKSLQDKGDYPNILSMTATPIPRTLAFTIHGEMDISWIDEMPKGRAPIITEIIYKNNIDSVFDQMKKEMDIGHYCYMVFPLIEESDKMDLNDAKSAYENLKKTILKKYSLGFMHGKLTKEDKNKLMQDFNSGKIQCLISTTVIEVGIDNPNATIMVIQNAERFGLTQLHQLRGRVGRSSLQSYCYLIQYNQTDISKKRLQIMEKTCDGFIISDEDLKLRGPGDFFGTKQHGYINMGLINFNQDREIIVQCRKKAFDIIDNDNKLSLVKNQLIKKEFIENYKSMLEFINIG